ncbi:helix-turn-helix transcriptional regulator [Lutibacter sp. TH_r2]|uniref:AraC family transcriptional regulator n=1 Tax=Lutibacter sp. TH_r2 TaxID=3082083 RepID=UPI002952C81F|nr:helix-turn-helix transcriptional regulator [Lutibacter sp. TH_r2]MDV7187987.1 helix-turn-helix transcriptional regulator [Lutibacter sp. TH_r2]
MKDIIKKYEFKSKLKLEFEILDLSEIFETKKDMMTLPHRAQFYHILWIEEGKGTHFVDFEPITIENNSIICVPHNSVNKFDKDGVYKGKTILFTDSFFCKSTYDSQFLHSTRLFSDLYSVTKLKISPEVSGLQVILNAMETEYMRASDNTQYHILYNMLHVFLLQMEREMRNQGFVELKPSINLDYLFSFKNLLEKNFKTEKSVSNYALELGFSAKQLNKATTALLDKTPKQIIDERILLEAKRLLAHSSQSVKEIAYELGYDEPTNFIKYFRKHTNSTPSEFRDQF